MTMWMFGAIITLGLLSFNLTRVRVLGDPALPYSLAGVGYPGLPLTMLAVVWRFPALLENRAMAASKLPAAAPAVVMEMT